MASTSIPLPCNRRSRWATNSWPNLTNDTTTYSRNDRGSPMDFDLTDEQRLLKDSVDRLIADQYQFEQRKKYMAETAGFSPAVWNQYAEIGLLGLPFEETLGGFGGTAVETSIVMEAFGRGLILEPYFATVILGGGLLRRAGSDALRGAVVPQVVSGKLRLAFAHIERHSRYDLADVSTTARKDGSAW